MSKHSGNLRRATPISSILGDMLHKLASLTLSYKEMPLFKSSHTCVDGNHDEDASSHEQLISPEKSLTFLVMC